MSALMPCQRQALRVLVVEDCADTRESLGILLGRWGHQVDLARDGASALAKAAVNPPDVVLLDIGLPGMSGWEVAQHLRADAVGRSVVLVALTGYGQEHDRQHARDVGCDLHLLKPVEPRVLEEFLEHTETRRALARLAEARTA
jgi:CheY-like chemotaxis protein